MGNRGRLHRPDGTIIRAFETRRWIVCTLEFNGIRRQIMDPNSYTELFFADEPTALAAGHRPCFTCQRASAKEFLRLSGFKSVNELDTILHEERLSEPEPFYTEANLPVGTILSNPTGDFFQITETQLLQWGPTGYKTTTQIPTPTWKILTPVTTRTILHRGYQPKGHLEKHDPLSEPIDEHRG
jgi:hypothetical protein